MPLNDTEAERRQQAARDLADKLKLERRLMPELREFFRTMSKDLNAFYSQTGQVPRADVYAPDLAGILNRHYRRTETVFGGNVTDFLEENSDNEEEAIIAALLLIAANSGRTVDDVIEEMVNTVRIQEQNFTRANVEEDVSLITRTNQKELDASVALATAVLIERLGRDPTRSETAKLAAAEFRKSSFKRSNTIAMTVTQKAAEGIKEIERDVFFDNVNDLGARQLGVQFLEEAVFWQTLGDEKVRASHIAADGQKRQAGFFTVQSEFLRFPGDPSGSPSNIINCRCSAVLAIE